MQVGVINSKITPPKNNPPQIKLCFSSDLKAGGREITVVVGVLKVRRLPNEEKIDESDKAQQVTGKGRPFEIQMKI